MIRWCHEPAQKATAEEDKAKLHWLDAHLAGKELDTINRDMIDRITQAKLADRCSNATVNRTLALVPRRPILWVRIFSITCRSRMAALILSSPAPQLGQRCMSIPNTRLSSCAQLYGRVAPGRSRSRIGGGYGFGALFCPSRLLRQHQRPRLGVRGQNAVKAY